MASVVVFVDDVVLGRLPPVCAKTGTPADMTIIDRSPVGGLGLAWLLLLFGPIGWLALAIMAVSGLGQDRLAVQLPFTRVTADSVRRHRHLSRWLLGGGAGLLFLTMFVGSVVFPDSRVSLAVTGLLIIGAIVSHTRAEMLGIGVKLDASKRWVTLTGVAPEFAGAVRLWQQQREFTPPT